MIRKAKSFHLSAWNYSSEGSPGVLHCNSGASLPASTKATRAGLQNSGWPLDINKESLILIY